jgi:hypothetical protein
VARNVVELNYFFNYGTGVPYDKNLNMADPSFKYQYKALLNTQVANPFRNYLTPDKFPGSLRNTATVTLGSLLVPYPQYSSLLQRNTDDGRHMRTHTVELRVQRPFSHGVSFFAAYAWTNEQRMEWFDDLAQYQVFTSGGTDGWEWRQTDSPVHRVTAAATWQLPIGRERRYLANLSAAARRRDRRMAADAGRAVLLGPGRSCSTRASSSTATRASAVRPTIAGSIRRSSAACRIRSRRATARGCGTGSSVRACSSRT